MKNKILATSSILLISISFFMGVNTEYFPALGDYVVQAIGLRAWTNGNSGMHLTIFYFLIPFIIGLIGVNRYCYKELKTKKLKVFLLICLLLFIFTNSINVYAEWVKKNEQGLLSVELIGRESRFFFSANNQEVTELSGEIKLKNHSNEKREFYLSIDNPTEFLYPKTKNKYGFIACGRDGASVLITLEPKSTELVKVDFKKNVDGMEFEPTSSASGPINKVLLFNEKEEVLLSHEKFWGIKLTDNISISKIDGSFEIIGMVAQK